MATYSTVKGFTIQSLSSDPPAPVEGQVWYNTASNVLKGYGAQGTGAWASAGALNTARQGAANFGIQTAAICAAGYTGSPSNLCESYNGTAWTEVNNTTDSNYAFAGSFGTQTAGIKAGGGSASNVTESWDGTCWTSSANLATGVGDAEAGSGTQTAGIVACGWITPNDQKIAQTYDGTSWAAANSCNTARSYVARSGITQDTAIVTGGSVSPQQQTETYNGTSWTEVSDLNTGRQNASGGGPSTSGLVFGGSPPYRALTENWNGTSWTEVADLATAVYRSGAGSNSPGTTNISFGGYTGAYADATEEWTVPDAIKTFTAS